VLLFQWRIFGTGWLQQALLRQLNRGYDDWDADFESLGRDAATCVKEYCEKYGVQQQPWIWSKQAAQYGGRFPQRLPCYTAAQNLSGTRIGIAGTVP
jgi:hypothetical protein